MAVAELAPREKGVEVTSPQINYTAGDKTYNFHWFNTVIQMYGKGYDDHLRYFDESESKVMVPDPLKWELLDNKFPFRSFPTPAVEKHWNHPQGLTDNYKLEYYEPLTIERGDESFDLRWSNTVIRAYGKEEYNHIEFRELDSSTQTHNVRGIFVGPKEMKHLFDNGFSIIYFPTVEMDSITKKWFANRKV